MRSEKQRRLSVRAVRQELFQRQDPQVGLLQEPWYQQREASRPRERSLVPPRDPLEP